MQKKYFFPAIMATVAVLFSGCSNDNGPEGPVVDGEPGTLKISLAGGSYDQSRATGATPDESAVKKFTVYVFNAENDALEAAETFTNTTTATMSNLSTGFPKEIIVVANTPSTFPTFTAGDQKSKFLQASAAINLSYQTPANIGTNGMVMIGQTDSPITLSGTGTNQLTVNMKRLAAKVKLGTITLLPLGENDEELFEVTGVSIQRALASTDIFGNPVNAQSMFGGLVGSWNNPVPSPNFLYDAITRDLEVGNVETFDNYFYVLPNQTYDSCTLLTLESTYNGDPQYFPIRINDTMGSQNTDGTLVLSNYTYVINIVVNNLSEGTTDPDEPPTDASLEVTVEVDPWEMDIIQNVVW